MPELFSEAWEYWVPSEEMQEVEPETPSGFDGFDLNWSKIRSEGLNPGIRFGCKNPDAFEPREAPERHKDARPERRPRDCLSCGDLFVPSRPSDPQRYCSRSCVPPNRWLPDFVQCGICKRSFRPRRSATRYCGSRCAIIASRKTRARKPVSRLHRDLIQAMRRRGDCVARICGATGVSEFTVNEVIVAEKIAAKLAPPSPYCPLSVADVTAAFPDLRRREIELAVLLATFGKPVTRADWFAPSGIDPRNGRGRTDNGKRDYVVELERRDLVTRIYRAKKGVADGGRAPDLFTSGPKLLALTKGKNDGNESGPK